MIEQALKASMFSAAIGFAAIVAVSLPSYSIASLAFGMVMLPVAFIFAFALSVPLIQARGRIKEPYYFLVFLLIGIVGGVAAVNLVFQKAIFALWLMLTYGSLGAVCSISAWFYLYKWGARASNT